MDNNPPTGQMPPAAPGPGACPIRGITRNKLGQLVADVEGRDGPIEDARIARCFPWTLPSHYVSLRDKDGKEVVLLKTLDELDAASRQVVEQELREKVFNPRITRVVDYRNEFGVVSITAQTDRGEVTFQIRSRDDVRMLSDTRGLFRDADGNIYELADLNAIDPSSRKYLQEFF